MLPRAMEGFQPAFDSQRAAAEFPPVHAFLYCKPDKLASLIQPRSRKNDPKTGLYIVPTSVPHCDVRDMGIK
jgi:hypothetical protein